MGNLQDDGKGKFFAMKQLRQLWETLFQDDGGKKKISPRHTKSQWLTTTLF